VVCAHAEALAAPTVGAPFDPDIIWSRVDGDRELLRELVDLFVAGVKPMMEAIHSAIHKQDAVRLRQAAHALKGEVGNFVIHAAVDMTLRLEMMGRDDNLAEADAACRALEHLLERLVPALIALAQGEERPEEKAP
jgi:HPt (histidine-containing phosphotransfer) domain-containing protein